MIAQDFAKPNKGAAARKMTVLIVDDLQTIHIKEHNAEWTLRTA